jgi:dolichol-phosphate mannosyltransferase
MKRRLIVIPTYNEAGSIEALLNSIFDTVHGCEVLVVDDGSPDKTAEICRRLKEKHHYLHLMERAAKSGLGSAYRAGFAWALEREFEEIIEMDADSSHQVTDLMRMIDAKAHDSEVGLVIGSRWIKGGATQNWSKTRKLLSRTANVYVRLMLGMGIQDSTSGLRIYSAATLRDINIHQIRSEGYSFQIEMTRAARKTGAQILEVPITFKERENGVSKMSKKIVREAIFLVTVWGIRRILGKDN